jgi:hypothetical protein
MYFSARMDNSLQKEHDAQGQNAQNEVGKGTLILLKIGNKSARFSRKVGNLSRRHPCGGEEG